MKTLPIVAATLSLAVGFGFALAQDGAEQSKPAETKTEKSDKKMVPADWTYAGLGDPNLTEKIKTQLEPMLGKPMPKLELDEGFNGGKMTNDDLAGKIVIVDVWATWCPPCKAAIPHNNEVFAKYKDQGVVVLGVTTSSKQEDLDAMVNDLHIEYPVAKDPGEKTKANFNASFFPTYYAIDRDGIVRGVAIVPDKIDEVVEMLLKEQPAEQTAMAE